MVTCFRYGKKPTHELVVRELNRFAQDNKRTRVSGLKSRLRRHKLKWKELIKDAENRVKNSPLSF